MPLSKEQIEIQVGKLVTLFDEFRHSEGVFLEMAQGRQPFYVTDSPDELANTYKEWGLFQVVGNGIWGLTPDGKQVWEHYVYHDPYIEKHASNAFLSDKRAWVKDSSGTYHLQQHVKTGHAVSLAVMLQPKTIGDVETFSNRYRTQIANLQGMEVWTDRKWLSYNAAKSRAVNYLKNDEVMLNVIPEYLIPVYVIPTPNRSERCVYVARLKVAEQIMATQGHTDYVIHMMSPETVSQLSGDNRFNPFLHELS